MRRRDFGGKGASLKTNLLLLFPHGIFYPYQVPYAEE